MKCSHNELASLIKKAAIGKGYSEGIAKEIAFAALCLPERQAEAACSALNSESGWPILEEGPPLFDYAFMILSSSQTSAFNKTLHDVNSLELLNGMAKAAAYHYGLITEIKTIKDETHISIYLGETMPRPSHSGAINVPSEIYQALNILAEKTYVPATYASRLKGAGAGLTDND